MANVLRFMYEPHMKGNLCNMFFSDAKQLLDETARRGIDLKNLPELKLSNFTFSPMSIPISGVDTTCWHSTDHGTAGRVKEYLLVPRPNDGGTIGISLYYLVGQKKIIKDGDLDEIKYCAVWSPNGLNNQFAQEVQKGRIGIIDGPRKHHFSYVAKPESSKGIQRPHIIEKIDHSPLDHEEKYYQPDGKIIKNNTI
ncbi:MAG: hypothetical protein V1875_01400 [Candidatus Altiarchaeota archaeon]